MKLVDPLDSDFQKYVYETHKDGLVRMGWGSLPTDETVRNVFREVNEIVKPTRVVEVGMFVGHSTAMMFDHFDQLQILYSFDPNMVSYEAAKVLKEEYGDRFKFINMGFESNHVLMVDEDIDFVYIDGHHGKQSVMHDIHHARKFNKVKYILMDNLEHHGVAEACKAMGMYKLEHEPRYWMYTAYHRKRLKPGILGLFKV